MQTVVVTGLGDVLIDNDISYSVASPNTISSDANCDGLTVSTVSASNSDDDLAHVFVAVNGGVLHTSEQGGSDTLTFVLSAQLSVDVSYTLAVDDSNEATFSQSIIVFTPSNWSQAQTVIVTGRDDQVNDGDTLFYVIASSTRS